jgi:hypothetical protein
MGHRHGRARFFSLIELLVVIGIIEEGNTKP